MKTWYITSMQCVAKEGDLTDVVKLVYWGRVYEKIVDGVTYTQRIIGIQNFPQPSESSFIPYNELTFDEVCQWLESTLNVTEIDAELDVLMEEAINEPIKQLPLPWTSIPVLQQPVIEEPSEQQSGL